MPRSLLLAALLTLPALAQEEPAADAPRVVYKDVTEVDFERGLDLDGELIKPEGTIVAERTRAVFASFIELRTAFDEEMQASVDAVK
jgi:hypothetical protein